MRKDLTTKDVLYALEYLHDAMVRVPPQTMGGAAKWRMKSSGAPIKDSIANEVRASGSVASLSERNGSELIVWRSAA
jgi:hypothetical protein